MRGGVARAWIVSLGLGLTAGCTNLSDFSGDYEGPIIDGNFVRRCFPAGTTAMLDFDPERAVAATEVPDTLNRLTTSDGSFQSTELLPLTALPHDQLSSFDFPGPTRVRNYLLLARPEQGPLAGRDVVVVVSILEKGSLEVRVMGRTEDDAAPCVVASETDDEALAGDGHEYFGVFQLEE